MTKEKNTDKLDLIKIKNFLLQETTKKVKIQPTEWEKILQIQCQIRDFYLDDINNSFNSVIKRQPN